MKGKFYHSIAILNSIRGTLRKDKFKKHLLGAAFLYLK
jgi:hypothetical protein